MGICISCFDGPTYEPTYESKNCTDIPILRDYVGMRDMIIGYSKAVTLLCCDKSCIVLHQFSVDGVHWDKEIQYEVKAREPTVCESNTCGKWFRMIIINTGGPSGFLRVHTSFLR